MHFLIGQDNIDGLNLKIMKFKTGQEIVCISKIWNLVEGPEYYGAKPIYNEIYICNGYLNHYAIYLTAFGKEVAFHDMAFSPVLSSLDEIKEVLENLEPA